MRIIFFCNLIFSALYLPFFLKKDFKIPPVFEEIPPYNPIWEFAPPNREIQHILKQDFLYLAKGNQSTVFLSEDGNYVLKLFRYTRSRFPLIHKIKNHFKKKPKMDLLTKINKTLNGAYLAFTEAKEFTQVIYCHLNLSKQTLPKATLHHKKKTFHLSLDRHRFVLQKKAVTFKETLNQNRDDPKLVEQLILSFIDLIIQRSALDIRNSDPNLSPNFGFLDGKAVELDFGNYHKIKDPKQKISEFENLMNRFEDWILKNMPEYSQKLKDLRLKAQSFYDANQ